MINLHRWLIHTGSPEMYAEQFELRPEQLKNLLILLGGSQPLADTLIQNPEFGYLLLDPSETDKRPSIQEIFAEGERLLASSSSPSHSLDRIRYLKQRHNLIICLNDLGGTWPQEDVWEALSDVAEAVVDLTLLTVWKQFAMGKDLPEKPPVGIVAFGKMGGRELNYSSDIDLAYVLDESVTEYVEKECVKFCAAFGRALSDRMGRGALYRIDLRLRPYGAQGPLLVKLSAFKNYYKLYAEAWEIQALIKSRVIYGSELSTAWEELKDTRVYASSVSDSSLAEVMSTRRRIEEFSDEDDLKRGTGGIRDVEFLCQTFQLVYGPAHPEIRKRGTCEALRAMADEHLIDWSIASTLIDGYTFLRKLEHRLQLVGDLQTHSLPTDESNRDKVAKLMGYGDWSRLKTPLDRNRKSIRSLYYSVLKQDEGNAGVREELGNLVQPYGSSLMQWFDSLPESDAYYRSLSENEGSLGRVKSVLHLAPRLIGHFKTNLALTDALISGEIEEFESSSRRWESLPLDASEQAVSDLYTNSLVKVQTQWVLGSGVDLSFYTAEHTDGLIRYCCRRYSAPFDVIALGSYGSHTQAINSDIDLLLLSRFDHGAAEKCAQEVMNFLLRLKRFGLEPGVDLRLRPEGKKGLLVRSFDGFGAYEVDDMEMWERFALGNARSVHGSSEALDLVRHAAYANALTRVRLSELTEMKKRIETERLKPQYRTRDVKLGFGGLNDLEWVVHLYEMTDPQTIGAGLEPMEEERIRALGRANVLNAFEVESLITALRHLLKLRIWIALLEFPLDLVPENPAKLNRLANAFGLLDGNEFLRLHEPIVGWLRGFLSETLTRIEAKC